MNLVQVSTRQVNSLSNVSFSNDKIMNTQNSTGRPISLDTTNGLHRGTQMKASKFLIYPIILVKFVQKKEKSDRIFPGLKISHP